MGKYAEDTKVPVGQSLSEIDRIITRYGAQQFGWGKDMTLGRAWIGFSCRNIVYKIEFRLPAKDDDDIKYIIRNKIRYKRSDLQLEEAWEQSHRQRWRAVVLYIKAKLEAVESEISTLEQEFMAHILLGDGRTVKDYVLPQLEDGVKSGKMPTLLPFFDKNKP